MESQQNSFNEQITLLPSETIICELVPQDEYLHHRNQVAMVTDQHIVFLKKKTIGSYYSIQYISLSDCNHIAYTKKIALGAMIGGLFFFIIGLLVLIFAVTGQLRNIQAAIYGIPLLGIGASFIFGIKRHKLTFRCNNQNLYWLSAAGKYKKNILILHKINKLARSKRIDTSGF